MKGGVNQQLGWWNTFTVVLWQFDEHESLETTSSHLPRRSDSNCNARRNAERLSRRQSHCDAAACLIDWLSNWSSATTPIDKGRKRARCALIIRWFTIVSGFLFLVWFMLVGVSVVSAEASITECGCAQSCSPLQAAAVIPWLTLNNVSCSCIIQLYHAVIHDHWTMWATSNVSCSIVIENEQSQKQKQHTASSEYIIWQILAMLQCCQWDFINTGDH